jgi:SNF2 family DNA or RNA helicase
MQYEPFKYQKFAEEHVYNNRYSGLFLDMGLGKTVITLTALRRLIKECFEVRKVLIIAPLNVAKHVWSDERDKFTHLRDLKISKVLGTERQRIRALNTQADIYIINRDNIAWLVAFYGEQRWPFDCIVVDESSSIKNQNSERFKALQKVRPVTFRVILLTGTPAPNSLMELWPQIYMLDMGARLGKTITYYRDNFFREGKKNGYTVYNYKLLPEADKRIYKQIGDIVISMEAEDYIDLPEKIDRTISVELDGRTMQKYYEFEKESVIQLFGSGQEITAINAGVLTMKLAQFASGAIYDEDKHVHLIHDCKLDRMEEIVDTLNGSPLIIFYWFKHSYARLSERLKKLKPCNLKGDGDVKKWNSGKIKVALLHPASAGHGLNLQFGGYNSAWYDNPYSLELFKQADRRLYRPGQKSKFVITNRMVAKGTIDEEIIKAQALKDKGQKALMRAVRARIDKYL